MNQNQKVKKMIAESDIRFEYEADIKDFEDNFCHLLDGGDCYWSVIGEGSYKECYDAGLQDYIVKGAADFNPTQLEIDVLNAAEEHGFKDMFAETYFFEVNKPYSAFELYNDEELPTMIDTLIVQRFVNTLEHMNPAWADTSDFQKAFPEIDTTILLSLWGRGCFSWVKAIEEFYGMDYLKAFVKFCDWYQIEDMHSGNIGYDSKGRPVIFDWYSLPIRP